MSVPCKETQTKPTRTTMYYSTNYYNFEPALRLLKTLSLTTCTYGAHKVHSCKNKQVHTANPFRVYRRGPGPRVQMRPLTACTDEAVTHQRQLNQHATVNILEPISTTSKVMHIQWLMHPYYLSGFCTINFPGLMTITWKPGPSTRIPYGRSTNIKDTSDLYMVGQRSVRSEYQEHQKKFLHWTQITSRSQFMKISVLRSVPAEAGGFTWIPEVDTRMKQPRVTRLKRTDSRKRITNSIAVVSPTRILGL